MYKCYETVYGLTDLPTLPDSAESTLYQNQSFHVLVNTFENLPDDGNFFPIYGECNCKHLPDCCTKPHRLQDANVGSSGLEA